MRTLSYKKALVMVLTGVLMLGLSACADNDKLVGTQDEYTGEVQVVTYKYKDTEYSLEELESVITEPVLVTEITKHEDNICTYEDVYVTISETVDSTTEKYLGDTKTLVVPRSMVSSTSSFGEVDSDASN